MEDTVRANSQPGAVARQHREHNSVLSTVKAIVSPLLPVFSLIAKGWNGMGRPARVTLVIVTALALWETVRFFDIPVFLVPPPTMVLEIMWQEPRWMLLHSWHTLFETFIGFGLAVSFGILLAVLIVSSKFLEETLYVLLVTMNSVPKVAIAPLFVVWMGTGLSPKVAISATIALFVIVIDMVLGLRSVDPEMLDLAKSFKGSAWQILVKIRFPNSLPNLFAGMKVGITLALIGAIVGEFVASDRDWVTSSWLLRASSTRRRCLPPSSCSRSWARCFSSSSTCASASPFPGMFRGGAKTAGANLRPPTPSEPVLNGCSAAGRHVPARGLFSDPRTAHRAALSAHTRTGKLHRPPNRQPALRPRQESWP